jgi:hypothetical protein
VSIKHIVLIILVLSNHPSFRDKVVNNKKRFLYFYPKHSHPASLTPEWKHLFPEEGKGESPTYYFLRKLDVKRKEGKELVQWIREKHIGKHLYEEEYEELAGKAFVGGAN